MLWNVLKNILKNVSKELELLKTKLEIVDDFMSENLELLHKNEKNKSLKQKLHTKHKLWKKKKKEEAVFENWKSWKLFQSGRS